MPVPTIPASNPVTIQPPAAPPVYDKWWMGLEIDEKDTANVKVNVRLRRARSDENGEIQWMSNDEASIAGVSPTVTYTVDHVLDRAAGIYQPPNGPDGKPVHDPLHTPEVQAILAQVAGGMLEGVTRLGQILGVL